VSYGHAKASTRGCTEKDNFFVRSRHVRSVKLSIQKVRRNVVKVCGFYIDVGDYAFRRSVTLIRNGTQATQKLTPDASLSSQLLGSHEQPTEDVGSLRIQQDLKQAWERLSKYTETFGLQ
jgi:hypothetical protein